jgi:citrate synthase
MLMARNMLTTEQAAARLGVQRATIYAYVSRGVLSRSLAEDGKTSRFDAAEVDKLARRGRPRSDGQRPGSVDVSLATAITCIEAERLSYRGHDVVELVERCNFEATAELLWTGELQGRVTWSAPELPRDWLRAFRLEPVSDAAIEQLAAITAALACRQPLRVDLRPPAVLNQARTLLCVLSSALPRLPTANAAHTTSDGIAQQLWSRLSPLPATAARVAALDAALVLMADHELATSTVAARVAASTRADPYGVVLAGLGALSGPLHGKAALSAQALLLDAAAAPAPELAVARVVARGDRLSGFGHPVYRGLDPRARCLLERVWTLVKRSERTLIETVASVGSSAASREPNVDFALAALAFAARMPLGATEAILAIARSAGWIAHALEEYTEQPLRFRARAIYIGPHPVARPS